MTPGFSLDDYVDVAERIRLFYDKYPDGRLRTVAHDLYHIGERSFVFCQALAYRTADDPNPCAGTAWEPIPGPTPYTKDSELMNAETAAWGRAIVAAGIPSKKIASAEEARARQPTPQADKPAANVSNPQHAKIAEIIKDLQAAAPGTDWVDYSRSWIDNAFGKRSRADLTKPEASKLIAHLNELLEAQGIPF